jgi:hypothetical protein
LLLLLSVCVFPLIFMILEDSGEHDDKQRSNNIILLLFKAY